MARERRISRFPNSFLLKKKSKFSLTLSFVLMKKNTWPLDNRDKNCIFLDKCNFLIFFILTKTNSKSCYNLQQIRQWTFTSTYKQTRRPVGVSKTTPTWHVNKPVGRRYVIGRTNPILRLVPTVPKDWPRDCVEPMRNAACTTRNASSKCYAWWFWNISFVGRPCILSTRWRRSTRI